MNNGGKGGEGGYYGEDQPLPEESDEETNP